MTMTAAAETVNPAEQERLELQKKCNEVIGGTNPMLAEVLSHFPKEAERFIAGQEYLYTQSRDQDRKYYRDSSPYDNPKYIPDHAKNSNYLFPYYLIQQIRMISSLRKKYFRLEESSSGSRDDIRMAESLVFAATNKEEESQRQYPYGAFGVKLVETANLTAAEVEFLKACLEADKLRAEMAEERKRLEAEYKAKREEITNKASLLRTGMSEKHKELLLLTPTPENQ